MKAHYPIIVEEGRDETAWGITVPDLTGCFSAADNENDILDAAREAILLHLEGLENVPDASPIDNFTHDNRLALLVDVDVDIAQLKRQAKHINVTVSQKRKNSMTICKAVGELLRIAKELHINYPHREFTLDGRLVGDLGEVIVEQNYEVTLYPSSQKHHDGETPDGKKIQIKTTMKNALTFPCDHIPDYYLGIKILPNGDYEEIFNGPGKVIHSEISHRKRTKTNLYPIELPTLKKLDEAVQKNQRIPKKTETGNSSFKNENCSSSSLD